MNRRDANRLQTTLLLGGMVALLATLGLLVAGNLGLIWGLFLGIGMAGVGRASPASLLRLQGARQLLPGEAPGLGSVVKELSRRAGLDSVPDLYYLPSHELNAFTTGYRGPGSAIVLSDGLLRSMGPRELVGVVAHEIAHVGNGDMALMSMAESVSRLTRLMSTIGQVLLLLNLPMLLVGQVVVSWWVVLLLLGAPTISALLHLGISRTREYEADQRAAELTGDPRGLASALVRMERERRGLLRGLFLPARRAPESALLRTHPRTEDRVRRLLERDGPSVTRPPRIATGGQWGDPGSGRIWNRHPGRILRAGGAA